MIYIWIDEKDGNGFVPYMEFEKSKSDSTVMTDWQFEIQALREAGFKAKKGEAF